MVHNDLNVVGNLTWQLYILLTLLTVRIQYNLVDKELNVIGSLAVQLVLQSVLASDTVTSYVASETDKRKCRGYSKL